MPTSEPGPYCQRCQRVFPADLLSVLEISNGTYESAGLMCPMCALQIVNKLLGLPLETPFRGETAREMHGRAIAFIRGQRKKKKKE